MESQQHLSREASRQTDGFGIFIIVAEFEQSEQLQQGLYAPGIAAKSAEWCRFSHELQEARFEHHLGDASGQSDRVGICRIVAESEQNEQQQQTRPVFSRDRRRTLLYIAWKTSLASRRRLNNIREARFAHWAGWEGWQSKC